MVNGKTYYQILGLLTSAEGLVIRAAYRSLSNKYHPDKWTGDKAIGNARMSEINISYETLGVEEGRRKYDLELKKQGKYDDVSAIDDDNREFEGIYSEHSDSWDIAVQFYPALNALHDELKQINSSLAYTFKTLLLERKDFVKSEKLAKELERAFLSKYFGNDVNTLAFAKYLISNNFRAPARELNRIVNVMGASVSSSQIESLLYKKFPDLPSSALVKNFKIMAKSLTLSHHDAIEVLERVGATQIKFKDTFWAPSFSFLWVNGERKNFSSFRGLQFFIRDRAVSLL